jgi:hypothetical protein
MNYIKISLFILLILSAPVILFSQDEGTLKKDSVIKLVSDKPVPSGIFLSAGLGLDIPFDDFSDNSATALVLGARLEYSSLKLYPFVIGISYQYQKNEGTDEFNTLNLLNGSNTTIHSLGIGFDFIVNKYLNSSYTIPFIMLEAKYLIAERQINPESSLPEIPRKESVIGLSGGIGFTLYIFDIYGTYTHAKNYSSFEVKTRFRIPIIRF